MGLSCKGELENSTRQMADRTDARTRDRAEMGRSMLRPYTKEKRASRWTGPLRKKTG